jgi:DNA topoisomerase-3
VGKSLIITEKPSVARDIAAVFGNLEDHDGWFEGDDYIVTFAVGHLFELPPPEEVNPEWKAWTLDKLPMIPEAFALKPKQGHSERIRTIKKLAARADVDGLVNACDAGREGELIFREIAQYLGNTKPVLRLWLQSMTTQAIRNGFEALVPGEEKELLGQAAECRAWSDWLIGMNATRALTKRLKTRSERGAWSAGRVQTPTLALLVGRELEVLAHVPRPYWKVEGSFEHEGQTYSGTWFDPDFKARDDDEAKDDRIFDEARARAIVQAVTAAQGMAEETRKPSRETAPPLFDLTSLQREGNRRFGWSAKRTLGAAQRCYDGHKILTYPRTDSRCLPDDYRATVDELMRTFAGAGDRQGAVAFGDYADAAARLKKQGLTNTKRTFDDSRVSDHFAIIPTGVLPGDGLSGDDRRLYDLVVRRFLGTFHPPAVWERVERVTLAAGERFRTRARSLQEPGWRAVLTRSGEDEESTTLPPLRPGADAVSDVAVTTRAAELEVEETRPPPRITEGRILSLMENAGKQIEDEDLAAALHEKGIGTPATRADIIENLIRKGYVVRTGKALRPTVKGIRLIDILKRIHADRISSPELTGEIEHHLAQVEKGERSSRDFMREIEDYTREIVEIAKTFEYEDLYGHEEPIGECPVCGRPVYEAAWFYTCERTQRKKGEEDDRCPLVLWKDTSGRYLDRRHAALLLKEGKTGVLDGFMARDGRLYKGELEILREEWKVKVRSMGSSDDAASDQPDYDVNPEPLGRCPFDEDCGIVESPTQFLCERKLKELESGKDPELPKGCGFALPRTVCKREITREEALVYLANRRTDVLTDFTSRYGRPFSATLVLKENGRHGFEFPPRKVGEGGRKTTRKKKKKSGTKKAGRKTTTRKKKTTVKASGKKATTRKVAGRKKATKTAAKASSRKKATRRPAPGDDA